MEEIREIYQTVSDYILSPVFLGVGVGLFMTGSAICLSSSAYIIKKVRKMVGKNSLLERKSREI